MKNSFFALLVCFCLLLMGCPLQTETPIKGGKAEIPSWMPGQWTIVTKEGKLGSSSYQVKADPSGKAKLLVISITEDGKEDKDNIRPAELSKVRGQLYLSVFEKGDESSEAGYYHYGIFVGSLSNADMQLVPLKEHIVSSGASGEEIAAYILNHAASDFLDQNSRELYRKQK